MINLDYFLNETGKVCAKRTAEAHFLKQMPEIRIDILKFKSFNTELSELSFHQLLFHYINKKEHIPKCSNCTNNTKYYGLLNGYAKFCSYKCSGVSCKTKERKNAIALSREEKKKLDPFYYVEKNKLIQKENNKELFIETKFLDNHYVDVPYKQRTWHYKRNLLELQKCICGNLMVFIDKRYKYCSRKCTDLVTRKKSEDTNILKYGVKNPFQSDEVKLKIKDTCLVKYGLQNAGALDHFNYKDYILPSGRKIRVQGFENKALDILLTVYNENDILYGPKEIHAHIGHIEYKLDKKTKRYYPDFFIKSINTIIEVKSSWTYDKKGKDLKLRNINELKKKACLKIGLNFQFMIDP